MLRGMWMGLIVWVLWQGGHTEAQTKLPLKQLVRLVDRLDPRAISMIEEHLNGSRLRPKERAQLLQLKSLYQVQKLRTIEAKALYIRALEIDVQVGLLGQMTEPTRRQYQVWRQEFLQQRATQRPTPPKQGTSPFSNKPLFRGIYGTLLGLGGTGLIVGGIGTGLAVQQTDAYHALLRMPPSTALTRQLLSAHRQAQEAQTWSVIAWLGGGVLVATGVVLAVLVESSPLSVESSLPSVSK